MDNCEYCKVASGAYDFNNVCCCVRLLLSVPRREARKKWLSIWRKRKGDNFASDIENGVIEQWKKQ